MTPAPREPAKEDGCPRPGALYANSREALQAVHRDYHYWTERLTDLSFQLSLAVIAANWAVYGSAQKVFDSNWAKASVILIVFSLGIALVGAKLLGEEHLKILNRAERDPEGWERQCAKSYGRRGPWPFTWQIEHLAVVLRWVKAWIPLAAGAVFVVGLLVP